MATQCPVCVHSADLVPVPAEDMNEYNCVRCGRYRIVRSLEATLRTKLPPDAPGWIVLSRTIAHGQRPDGTPLEIHSGNFQHFIAGAKFPNPAQQANELLLFLGDAGVGPSEYVQVRRERLMGYIGTPDRGGTGKEKGLNWITLWMKDDGGLIDWDTSSGPGATWRVRLTPKGWHRFETLQRENPDSRIAFMAMAYNVQDIERAFKECFIPAVAVTGFELRRLDTTPKAGLIDLRMRVDLRACKFVVADLTDENRGAYWEAGFAEGLGRHVFYTCEATNFDKVAKRYFDVEHMLTIKWSLAKLATAGEELKAAIRNTFPAEAKQHD